MLTVLTEMRKILNHPIEVGLSERYKWDDSGKYLALQELFEQLGFGEDDPLVQNKVNFDSLCVGYYLLEVHHNHRLHRGPVPQEQLPQSQVSETHRQHQNRTKIPDRTDI